VTRAHSRDDLAKAVRAAGFTPRANEASALVALAATDPALAADVARALAQLGDRALPPLREALARGDDRPAAVRLAGKLAAQLPELAADVGRLVADPDAKVRRAAIHAAGRLGQALETPLLARLGAPDGSPAEQAALVEALGKIGGPEARAALARLPKDEVTGTALLRIDRTLARDTPSEIDTTRKPPRPLAVELTCRPGLEGLLCEELGSGARALGPGRVGLRLGEPLATLFRARTWIRIEIDLGRADQIADLLAADATFELLRALTRGPIRYRLEWLGAGPRRAATRQVALAVAERRPELENDPSETTWDVLVSARRVALSPRRLADPRFGWRVADVPAASHPTVAAALARVAGVLPDDVVWDPFVGSAGELVERGLAGPFVSLHGTDRDEGALAAARKNLAAAGLDATLHFGDARQAHPEKATLIMTNPPLGHRVAAPAGLLDEILGVSARLLTPRGRLVWISPTPDQSVATARRLGLRVVLRQPVDLGGLTGEIQRFER
jgi:hypothetical protein